MTCTKKQVQTLFKYAKTLTQEAAAAKAGMSLRTARQYLNSGDDMGEKPEWKWRQTHKDAFAEVWTELDAMLRTDPGLQAQTLMQWLMDEYGDKYNWGQLLPGKQSQSDCAGHSHRRSRPLLI